MTAGQEPEAPATLKAKARKLAEPVLARARTEMARAANDDVAALRAEVVELREELERQRAEHAAAIAALHEELAVRPAPEA